MLWDSRCISLLHSFRAACPPALPQFCLCLDGFFISVQALFCKSYRADRPEVLPQARYQADTVRTNVPCGIYDARHLVVLIVWIDFPHALPFVVSVARPLYYLWHCTLKIPMAMFNLLDFGLLPRCKWDLSLSGIAWPTYCLKSLVTDYQSTLSRNIPEKRRSRYLICIVLVE
jgi:hypothetical protein